MAVEQDGQSASAPLRMDLALFALAAAVLTLEVLETRIFAFTLDGLTMHVAIGICLLGLGASGTLLALLPPFSNERARDLAAYSGFAAAVAVIVSHAAFSRISDGYATGNVGISATLTLALPYFFLGVSTALLLSARVSRVGRAYAFNLIGSGVGCLLIFPLLDRLGAELLLVVVGGFCVIAALLLSPSSGRAVLSGVVAAVLLIGGAFAAPGLFPFVPNAGSHLGAVIQKVEGMQEANPRAGIAAIPLFQRWDRTGRIDVYDIQLPTVTRRRGDAIERPLPTLVWMQDGGAGSWYMGAGKNPKAFLDVYERSIYGIGYALGVPDEVLIIGLGGGPDILTALHYGAPRVAAVDINATGLELLTHQFAEYLGDPVSRPEVTLHRMDGRTFVGRSDKRFDLIQMSGVDTKALFAAGSLSMSENYLYTHEALIEYLEHLSDDGMLVILRPKGFQSHRITTVALDALASVGAEAPKDHLFVMQQAIWDGLLVKRTPFTRDEIERLRAWVLERGERPPNVFIPFLDWVGFGLETPLRVLYSPLDDSTGGTRYFEALASGRLEEHIAQAPDDLMAPTDDRPFFFFPRRPAEAFTAPGSVLTRLYTVLVQQAGIAAVFILAPLLWFRRQGLRAPRAGTSLAYFAALGAGFMLVEIGLIQRFVLFLGHQSYSISVVLFGILAGASLGSMLSTRLPVSTRGPFAVVIAALVALMLFYAFFLETLFASLAGAPFGLRVAFSLALLIALGLGLGVGFPLGLRALHGRGERLVPWAIGVNGFASVLGATAAVPLAMVFGLRFVLLLGIAFYLLALVSAPLGAGRQTEGT